MKLLNFLLIFINSGNGDIYFMFSKFGNFILSAFVMPLVSKISSKKNHNNRSVPQKNSIPSQQNNYNPRNMENNIKICSLCIVIIIIIGIFIYHNYYRIDKNTKRPYPDANPTGYQNIYEYYFKLIFWITLKVLILIVCMNTGTSYLDILYKTKTLNNIQEKIDNKAIFFILYTAFLLQYSLLFIQINTDILLLDIALIILLNLFFHPYACKNVHQAMKDSFNYNRSIMTTSLPHSLRKICKRSGREWSEDQLLPLYYVKKMLGTPQLLHQQGIYKYHNYKFLESHLSPNLLKQYHQGLYKLFDKIAILFTTFVCVICSYLCMMKIYLCWLLISLLLISLLISLLFRRLHFLINNIFLKKKEDKNNQFLSEIYLPIPIYNSKPHIKEVEPSKISHIAEFIETEPWII